MPSDFIDFLLVFYFLLLIVIFHINYHAFEEFLIQFFAKLAFCEELPLLLFCFLQGSSSFLDSLTSQFIAAVIIDIIAMTLDLVKRDPMLTSQFAELLPKVLIFYWLTIRLAPALPLPVEQPSLQIGIADVRTIRIELHLAWLL